MPQQKEKKMSSFLAPSSSFTEDEAKDLKGSMLGWVDATESNGVIFSKKEVYIHPSASPKSHLPGFLSIVRQEAQVSIHWTPNSMIAGAPKPLVTQQPTRDDAIMRRESSCSKLGTSRAKLIEGPLEVSQKYSLKIPISEIYSMKKYIPSIGYSYLIVNTKGGVSHPPFYFHDGGLKEFLAVFDGFVTLTKSPEDPNAFLVNDHSDKLVRALSKFNIPPASPFSPQEETSPGLWDPTAAILGNFAKVTQVARALFDPRPLSTPRTITEERRKLLADYENFRKLRAKKGNQNILDHSQQTTTNLGEFEVLSSDSTRPIEEAVRKEPLSPARWKNFFDSEGRIVDVDSLKEEIFVGGLDPSLRVVAWKFLLGYYPMDSTEAERELIQQERREEYFTIKRQWTSITPRQEQYFSKFKKRFHQIEKDVERTDREHEFFKDDESPNLVKLHDILLTYTFFNFDLGYVQGMNDLLSPILMLMEDEADAFWCFVGYMETMRHNFDKDQHGMHKLLLNLRKILQLLDPQFYSYLEKVDSLNMFFCFRWLLINFKREFPLPKVMSLWEVIWACPLTPQFHLFVALAILQQHKEHIMSEQMQFDDLLKFCNELSMKLDLDYSLKEAEILFYKFQKLAVTPEQKQLAQ